MKETINVSKCYECPFYQKENQFCTILCTKRESKERCFAENEPQTHKLRLDKYEIIKILHQYQKWRRGKSNIMLPPKLYGHAIDSAIYFLRQNHICY